MIDEDRVRHERFVKVDQQARDAFEFETAKFHIDAYVAWCRYTEGGAIVTCDSGAPKAFKVYRHPEALLTEISEKAREVKRALMTLEYSLFAIEQLCYKENKAAHVCKPSCHNPCLLND